LGEPFVLMRKATPRRGRLDELAPRRAGPVLLWCGGLRPTRLQPTGPCPRCACAPVPRQGAPAAPCALRTRRRPTVIPHRTVTNYRSRPGAAAARPLLPVQAGVARRATAVRRSPPGGGAWPPPATVGARQRPRHRVRPLVDRRTPRRAPHSPRCASPLGGLTTVVKSTSAVACFEPLWDSFFCLQISCAGNTHDRLSEPILWEILALFLFARTAPCLTSQLARASRAIDGPPRLSP